jgi:SAM-dependent methyltransferase
MLGLLGVEPHHVVLDAPAWCGFLAEAIDNPSRVICVEAVEAFTKLIPPGPKVYVAPVTTLPIPSASVDRVGSLVGMHHLADKADFARELGRVLRPGGRVVLSEVAVDSAVAAFLNGPVNRYTFTGHRGRFVLPGEMTDLLWKHAKCRDVSEQHYKLFWRFSSEDQMVSYCRSLLGMARADDEQMRECLYGHFEIVTHAHERWLPWSLTYAVGSNAS